MIKFDKIVIQFLADLLYSKEYICFEEYEAICLASTVDDLDVVINKIFSGEFNTYLKGDKRMG